MKKTCIKISLCAFLTVLIVWAAMSLQAVSAYSGDDLYGNLNGEVSFSDIKATLPSPYKSCESITVSGSSGTGTYYFNVEMYLDKGFYVYGGPNDVSFS